MEETKTASKIRILIDCHVEADLSGMLWCRRYTDEEEHAKDLERACSEFIDFLKDHRSQDMASLSVVRDYQDQCSECETEWEVMPKNEDGTGVPVCAGCGVEVEL